MELEMHSYLGAKMNRKDGLEWKFLHVTPQETHHLPLKCQSRLQQMTFMNIFSLFFGENKT